MSQGVETVGLYVRDQDEALAFYVGKLGFRVHTDVKNGEFRWLTVQHPEQPSFQLGLFAPGPPVHDEATAQSVRAIVAKGAISVSLAEIGEDPFDEVHGVRPLGVARPLDSIPRRRPRRRLHLCPWLLFAHLYLQHQ